MPDTLKQANYSFPQTQAQAMTPDDNIGYIGSSSGLPGDTPGFNRMPDPNTDWATDETGQGQSDDGPFGGTPSPYED